MTREPKWVDVLSEAAAWSIHDQMLDPPPVVSLGLRELDESVLTWGMGKGVPRGTYLIVGGASNVGKTQYGLFLLKQAARAKERATLISLDMKERDALVRLQQSIVHQIHPSQWRPDRWRTDNVAKLIDGLREYHKGLDGGELAMVAPPHADLEWVRSVLYEGIELGVTFWVIDHLQKIRVEGYSDSQIHARAEVISETLDNIADEYGVTIVGLSQLNREASKQRDRRPQMSDLWGGTAMESNAALVILLDHSRYERDRTHHHLGRTWILLDKNQMGPKAKEVAVEINHQTLEYREAQPDEIKDWPDHKSRR